jgi:hypothetical protein
MNKAVIVLATAGLVSLCALANPAPAQARSWDPWPWPSQTIASPGPLYGYRSVYAPDALWDAYLRSRAVAPNVYATTYLEPAVLSGDRRIVRVWLPSEPGWHRRHRRHHG